MPPTVSLSHPCCEEMLAKKTDPFPPVGPTPAGISDGRDLVGFLRVFFCGEAFCWHGLFIAAFTLQVISIFYLGSLTA